MVSLWTRSDIDVSFSVALIIILTVMFHRSAIEREPRKYIDMD